MNTLNPESMSGGCGCGHVRYEAIKKPMFVHCCHCTWCQRESGTAFALNALIESTAVKLTQGKPVLIDTPSPSGRGQKIARCPQCQVAVWSHYAGLDELMTFIKVGTLDDPNQLPPDVHIFTSSKQSWLQLDDDVPVFSEYYKRKELWSDQSLARFDGLLALKRAQ